MQVIKSGDKLYTVVEAGPWKGVVPLEVKEKKHSCHRWQECRIKQPLWRQIVGFFEWSYEETKSETIVTLMYHEEHGWGAIVLPQRGWRGMSVDLIADHPDRAAAFATLGAGWEPMGSVHHHCSGSAFQSSTDRADEIGKEGLHITVGLIGKDEYDIDMRASFRGHITQVYVEDFFEVDEETARLVPEKLHGQLLECLLVKSGKGEWFPEWWKGNVIKSTPPVQHHAAFPPYHHNNYYPHRVPEHYRAPASAHPAYGLQDGQVVLQKQEVQQSSQTTDDLIDDEELFRFELKRLMQDYNTDCDGMLHLLQEMSQNQISDVVDLMQEHGYSVDQMVDEVLLLRHEEIEKQVDALSHEDPFKIVE